MPERELALAVLADAINCGQREFLLGQGDYAEISDFWFLVAGVERPNAGRIEKMIRAEEQAFYERARVRIKSRRK